MNVGVTNRSVARVERAAAMVESGAITPERSCGAKARFTSRNDARSAAKNLSRTCDRPMVVYHCAFCAGYHLSKLRHGEE